MAKHNLQPDPTKLNAIKTAYFAGLIDGEGYVGIKNHQRKNGLYKCAIITVGMSHEETIKSIFEYFQIGAFWKTDHHKNKGYLPIYWWSVSALQAITIAKLIEPFLITKKYQAREILGLPSNKLGGPFLCENNDYTKLLSKEQVEELRKSYKAAREHSIRIGKKRVQKGWLVSKSEELKIPKHILHNIIYNFGEYNK